ncbi:FAD-binding protein [Novosphingobium mangrovi (ex Huang et al. 2023)]|uniref:FAD-binding protein n=1 Tax=Novosphingobium mangrovi (ex Huang et al. 2023) TaxID=2976432 RepID=A0ABT2I605_9SPHN|nr:FAD-binding protein [Novosphingobium mangrovi (ex Huang et al. 2023)]MCT2400240.1 FAD-binding protein [Novosphingobium mangrovi (ex Huang et al. 2023)]
MLRNLPEKWDIEVDLVSIGSGIGGLSAAITGHEQGLSAIVLERADQVGGVTALSMGEVWVAGNHHATELGIDDSVDSGFRYLKRLSMDYGTDAAILNKVVHAREALRWFEDTIGLEMQVIRDCPDYYYGLNNDCVAEGRMLECKPFEASSLGDWQQRTRVSPTMPYALTHHDIFVNGGVANMMKWDFALMGERLTNDVRCLGAGLAAYFVKGALDRGIPMHTGANVVELIGDGSRVVGVRAQMDGKDVYVKGRRGVVLAVSSYERNQHFNKTLSQQLDLGSIVFSTVDGAHFRLAGPFGAQVAAVPDIASLGFPVPNAEDAEGAPLWGSALQAIGQPHIIVVNRAGKRFGDEAFYRQFYLTIDVIDGKDQTHPNFPCWMIIDSQAKSKYPIGPILPDQDWPEELGPSADTLSELAAKIGVDVAGLEATVARFNEHAEKGADPDFGRGERVWSHWMCGDPFNKPNPNLGTIAKGPFYALELKRIGDSGIPPAGLLTDQHNRALDWSGNPIDGLYVAGNSVARMETGAVMQSGISNARGMTHGWLAARHAAGDPSDLLDSEIQRMGI